MAGSNPISQPRVSVAGITPVYTLTKKLLGAALGAGLSGLVFIDSKAQALVVTVNSQDWEVTTFTGTYNANTSKFNTPENGGVMPWWGGNGSGDIAGEWAMRVNTGFGQVNDLFGNGFIYSGPLFGYICEGGNTVACATDIFTRSYISWYGGTTMTHYAKPYELNYVWAQATLVSGTGNAASVPGPLPIVGLAAAFGFSRKLRKRIKLHKAASAVSAPPVA